MSTRRKTIQLGGEAAPVFGLVGQYGDSDSDGEEAHDIKDNDVTPPHVNGSSSAQPLRDEKAPIDSQLANFMAEIDAIGGPPSPPPAPPAETSKVQPTKNHKKNPPKARNKAVMLGDMTFVAGGTTHTERTVTDPNIAKNKEYLEEPQEPVTVWQHCMDEGTQHYYYWNTQTNDVRWDIPSDFSQYLLQYKAYEEAKALYQSKKAELGDKVKSKTKENSSVESKPTEAKRSSTKQVKQTQESQPVMMGPSLPPKHPKEKQSSDQTFGPELPNSLIGLRKIRKEAAESKQEHSKGVEGNERLEMEQEVSEIKKEIVSPEHVSSDFSTEHELKNSSDVEADVEDDVMDDDEIYKKLEEPVFTQYESIIKKNKLDTEPPPPPATAPDDIDEDVDELDDIDKQLDMALEKKEGKSMGLKTGMKRKAGALLTLEDTPNTKLSRISPQESPGADEEAVSYIKRKLLKNKEQLKLKTEIADLATLITDKLEFLEITRKGLSKLQVLLIAIQTRIHDWKEGGLETTYLQGRLKDASKQLEQYETSAAPSGWLCQWDRMYKRYFYCHKRTGESRWEYPDEDDDGAAMPDQAVPPLPSSSRSSHGTMVIKPLPAPIEEEVLETTVDQEEQPICGEPVATENDDNLDGQPMDLDGNPMDESEAKSADDLDGKPLVEEIDEPPPPGTAPQGPLPNEVPPPLPPETYSDCESNASNPEEDSPEPPDDNMDYEQGPQDPEPGTIIAHPVMMKGDLPPGPEPVQPEPVTEAVPEDPPPVLPDSTSHTSIPEQYSPPPLKEKRKKKEKSKKTQSSLSMKKRNFPSMVQKWQNAQEDMENDMKKRKMAEQEAEAYAERMAEKWKLEEREKVTDT